MTRKTSMVEQIERIAWQELKRFAGIKKAKFRHGEQEIKIDVMQCSPEASILAFGNSPLYANRYVFEVAKKQLGGITPQEGDTITVDRTVYPIAVVDNAPCWADVGIHGITVRIHAMLPRREQDDD